MFQLSKLLVLRFKANKVLDLKPHVYGLLDFRIFGSKARGEIALSRNLTSEDKKKGLALYRLQQAEEALGDLFLIIGERLPKRISFYPIRLK